MTPRCRHCDSELTVSFCDLGMSPLANSYLSADQLDRMEPFYPLRAYVCSNCFLVQLQEFETPEHIFSDYAYFSSFSDSFVAHAEAYVEDMVTRFGFDETSQVIEIASNDGYLLQFFVAKNVPVLGIEPAANVAKAAEEKGIPTLVQFFNPETAASLSEQGKQADLLLGNNVLAHVPALNEFVRGMKIALKQRGVITMEFPHLLRLMQDNLFDTIYHEHFSYLSLYTVERVFAEYGLRVFDVQEVPTHGGSLRIFATHADNDERPTEPNVGAVKAAESDAGLQDLDAYRAFSERVKETKRSLLRFLMDAREQGKTVVGYGAPAKANTLLNYCGVRTDLLDYTVDRSPHKQDHFVPGVHVPIYGPERIDETKPDYLLIFPWNLKDEIMEQMAHIREWGGKFVVPIPNPKVLE
ncbi:MAG: methyltransferase domain-containing protein [Deltaproteobacteria bacterium]|nr:methyltransferase domain-containing protein [Deltaproteobacteria bacterium]